MAWRREPGGAGSAHVEFPVMVPVKMWGIERTGWISGCLRAGLWSRVVGESREEVAGGQCGGRANRTNP
jgi:hypothetical protein